MAHTIRYFGDPVPATYPNGEPIVVNGRQLLIPQNFSLQNEINAAHYKSPWLWFRTHYALGSSGDPQRQAGHSEGFDPRYTDAGNYAFALSAAAAGLSLETALGMATSVNKAGTGKALPAANENAIRQGFRDYAANRFPKADDSAGAIYARSVNVRDMVNASKTVLDFFTKKVEHSVGLSQPITETDVQRYAKARWGDLNSPDAKEFTANFKQAFGGYPQHVDIEQLHPLPVDGSIPSGKDVSLFVGRNGEVLSYARPPAPGGTGDSAASTDWMEVRTALEAPDWISSAMGPRSRSRSGLTRRPPAIRLAESMSLCRTVPKSTGRTIRSTDSSEGSWTTLILAAATIRLPNALGMSPPMPSQSCRSAGRLPPHPSLIPAHRPCRLFQPPTPLLRKLPLKDRFGNRAPSFQSARRLVPFFRCLLRSPLVRHNRARAAALA